MKLLFLAAVLAQSCRWLSGPDYQLKLSWSLVGSDIQFEIQGKTEGWLGVGISLDGSMSSSFLGSDVSLAWVDATGTAYAQDYFATAYMLPMLDSVQNVQVIEGSEVDGITKVSFTRPLLGDGMQDRDIDPSQSTYVIFALCDIDPQNEGSVFARHITKGMAEIRFDQVETCSGEPPAPAPPSSSGGASIVSEDETFILNWTIIHDEIHFHVEADATGWVGFGFSSEGMSNADMVVFWFDETTLKPVVIDSYTKAEKVRPFRDVDDGGSENFVLQDISKSAGKVKAYFIRKLITDDVHDMDILDTTMSLIWAYSEKPGIESPLSYERHVRSGAHSVNFIRSVANSNSNVIADGVISPSRRLHGALMLLSWFALLIGQIPPRYMREHDRKSWFYAHASVQCLGLLGVTAAIIAIYSTLGVLHDFGGIHGILGLIVFIMVWLQIAVKLAGYLSCLEEHHDHINDFHRWFGRCTLILAIVVQLFGLAHFNSTTVPYIAFVLALVFVALAAFSLHRSSRNNTRYVNHAIDKGPLARALILLVIALGFLLVVVVKVGGAEDTAESNPFQHCQDCVEMKILFDQYVVPVNLSNYEPSTEYRCIGFDVGVDASYHIVEFIPVIDNTRVLHHIIVSTVPYDTRKDGVFECSSMPDAALPIYGWAPGAQSSLKMPPEAGIPIGKNFDSRYLILQLHYDNPTLDTNQVDSSGVIIKLTSHLRPYDAGLMFFGTTGSDIALPPGKQEYEIKSVCYKNELENLPFPLHVVVESTHAHQLGRVLWLEHWRNDSMIRVLTSQVEFDFNEQEFRPSDAIIKPGDELAVHCIYDTRSRNQTTYGGESTRSEMCLGIVVYYPRVDAVGCGSRAIVLDPNDGHYRPDIHGLM